MSVAPKASQAPVLTGEGPTNTAWSAGEIGGEGHLPHSAVGALRASWAGAEDFLVGEPPMKPRAASPGQQKPQGECCPSPPMGHWLD